MGARKKKRPPASYLPSTKLARLVAASAAAASIKAKKAAGARAPAPVLAASPSSVASDKGSLPPPIPSDPSVESGLILDTQVPLAAVDGSPSSSVSPVVGKTISPEPVSAPEKVALSPRNLASVLQDSAKLQELGTPTQHISGAPFVLIPDENIAAAKEEFKEFLFARFPSDAPAMGRVIGVVNAIWARTGPRIFVHRIGQDTYLLKVSNLRTREILLSRNVWMVAGSPMFVAAWSPEFSPEEPPLTTAVVPVEFRGVPYLLFNKQSLSRIATAVGKPVSLAPETERKENFEVAKIWIRVRLLDDLPRRVVSGYSNGREAEISVSYPWLPPKCENCKKYGHDVHLCPQNVRRMYQGTDIPPPSGHSNSKTSRSRSRGSRKRGVSREGRPVTDKRSSTGPACDKEDLRSGAAQSAQVEPPSKVQNSENMILNSGKEQSSLTNEDASGPSVDLSPMGPNTTGPDHPDSGMTNTGSGNPGFSRHKQTVSLDQNLGSSAVIVFHESDIAPPSSSSAGPEESDAPFFLVNNRKCSRKATKA